VVSLGFVGDQSGYVVKPRLRVYTAGDLRPAVTPFVAESLPLMLAQG
jgi:hypothetical protein